MPKFTLILTSIIFLLPLSASAVDEAKKENISTVVVDTAPGSVSAMGMLGVGADQTTVVQNSRDLTVALKALDSKNSFGLGVTPARTALLPVDVSTYHDSLIARIWSATTFSLAQGHAKVGDADFVRRAVAVETSFFFFPETDDPLVMYWNALTNASTSDPTDVCNILLPTKPSSDNSAVPTLDRELNISADKRAEACRAKVASGARWNASRAWASIATGEFQLDSGGESRSIGRTIVLGATWGFGDVHAKTSSALTLAVLRSNGAPVLKTFQSPILSRENHTLAVLRFAVGGKNIRAIIEGSNTHDNDPTTATRVYKKAFGLDAKLADSLWLNVRLGAQRRIDNNGTENTSSFVLNFSPSSLLKL